MRRPTICDKMRTVIYVMLNIVRCVYVGVFYLHFNGTLKVVVVLVQYNVVSMFKI